METKELEQLLGPPLGTIAHIAAAVAERGIIERPEEEDQFVQLRARKEFRDLIVAEIYEHYFLPQRHEFDWQIVGQFVDAMCSSKVAERVASGVVGNAAYEILKYLLKRVQGALVAKGFSAERVGPYDKMRMNVEALERYFSGLGQCARIADIEAGTGLRREELYPLLRLLGFSHHRRKHNCLWCPSGVKPVKTHAG
jgi:hypothetical protein